jgi:hypothetical protein
MQDNDSPSAKTPEPVAEQGSRFAAERAMLQDLFTVRPYPVVSPKLARHDDAEGHEGHD